MATEYNDNGETIKSKVERVLPPNDDTYQAMEDANIEVPF